MIATVQGSLRRDIKRTIFWKLGGEWDEGGGRSLLLSLPARKRGEKCQTRVNKGNAEGGGKFTHAVTKRWAKAKEKGGETGYVLSTFTPQTMPGRKG